MLRTGLVLVNIVFSFIDYDQCRAELVRFSHPAISKYKIDTMRLSTLGIEMSKAQQHNDVDHYYSYLLLTTDHLILSERTNVAYQLLNQRQKLLPASTMQSKLLKAKAFGDVFFALDQPEKARGQYVLMLELARLKKTAYRQLLSDLLVTKHLSSRNSPDAIQNDMANDLVNKIIIADSPYISPASRAIFYLSLFKLDSAANNYKRSFRFYKLYKSVTDSVFRQEKLNRLNYLQQKFKLSEKQENNALKTPRKFSENALFMLECAGIVIAIWACALCFWKLSGRVRKQDDLMSWAAKESLLTEDAIKQLLDDQVKLKIETEELLKEAHHKVKNNLQMVMSLLNTQAMYLSNEAAIDVIDESQDRLQTMMIMHQKHYGNDGTTEIDMVAYIAELAAYLSTKLSEKGIEPQFSVQTDQVLIGNTQAVLIGLFIGEAVSNTLKGINEKTLACAISVRLASLAEDMIRLSITSRISSAIVKSCSYNLNFAIMMKALSDQLKGLFQIEQGDGVTVSVEFHQEKETENY